MPITLTEETTKAHIAALRHYFLQEREEEIGDLQASFLLDFMLKTVGPAVYNQGVRDAQTFLLAAVGDLDLNVNEPEI